MFIFIQYEDLRSSYFMFSQYWGSMYHSVLHFIKTGTKSPNVISQYVDPTEVIFRPYVLPGYIPQPILFKKEILEL